MASKVKTLKRTKPGKVEIIRADTRKTGKRRSRSGATYYEHRKNRTDLPGSLTGIGELSTEKVAASIVWFGDNVTTALMNYEVFLNRILLEPSSVLRKSQRAEILSLKKLISSAYKKIYSLRKHFNTFEK